MCGRYACGLQPLGRWAATFTVWLEEFNPSYNIAPSATIPVFTTRGWQTMRWGLIPSWAKDPAIKFSTFNARAESLPQKPAFRNAWKKGQLCLIPATGYYEWKTDSRGKWPYFIHADQEGPLVFAGIWDHWSGKEIDITSSAVITCQATGKVAAIHERRPLLLNPETARQWLQDSPSHHQRILESPPEIKLRWHQVDKKVGSTVHNYKELMLSTEPRLFAIPEEKN